MNSKVTPSKKAVASKNGDEGEGNPIAVPEITYQLAPEGMHEAWCVWVFDAGTHISHFNDGKKQRKLILGFELPHEKTTFDVERGPEPFVVHKIYTLTLHERGVLHRDLATWIGTRGIERVRPNLALLLGLPCQVNVVHKLTQKNQLRPDIISIARLPKATRIPPQITPALKYSISDGTGGAYDDLPEWVRTKFVDVSEEIGGARPSVEEITERNVRKAVANAHVEPQPHRPVSIDEPTSNELGDRLAAEAEESQN
jgi:hypothetical protein